MTEHTYIALTLQSIFDEDPELHLTLTFVEDATPAEQREAWAQYVNFFATRLPLRLSLTDAIKVGPNNDVDARDVSIPNELRAALDELYQKTQRRVGNPFPVWRPHVTVATKAKKRAAETQSGASSILFMATVGKHKRVLTKLSHYEMEAADE